MSTLYSHPDFPEKGPEEINEELMKNVSYNPLLLLTPQKIKRYVESLWKKKSSGQPVTFTDIFGMLIGETLIHNVSRGPIYNPFNTGRQCIPDCFKSKEICYIL
jgi:phospholipase A2